MHQEWLKEAPDWHDLVTEVKDSRNGRKGVAIVMPTYKNNPMTEKHLDLLAKQSCQDFDVILVYGQDDAFLEREGIVHIRRKGNYGSAGAFFIGEAFVLDEGYGTVILADNDCLPASDDLVQRLIDAVDGGAEIIFPRIKDGTREPVHVMRLPQYGCISVKTLMDVGLSYIPFYFAGEDVELHWRMKDRKTKLIDAIAEHPNPSVFALDRRRVFYYHRAGIAIPIFRDGYIHGFRKISDTLLFAEILALLRPDMAIHLLRAVLSGACLRLFSDAGAEQGGKQETQVQAHGIEMERCLPPKVKMNVLRSALELPRFIGREIIFDDAVGVGGLLIALAARKCWLRYRGEYHRVLDNRRYYLFPLFFGALILSLPALFLAALMLTVYGFSKKSLLGIDTWGYGTKPKTRNTRPKRENGPDEI